MSGFIIRGWNADDGAQVVSNQDPWGTEDSTASRKRKAYDFDEEVEEQEADEEECSRWRLVKRARRAVASSSMQGGWSLSMTKNTEPTASYGTSHTPGYAPSYFPAEGSALAPDSPTSVAEDIVTTPSNNPLPSFPSVLRRRITGGGKDNNNSNDSHILAPPSRSGLLSIGITAVKEHSKSSTKSANGEEDDDDEQREPGLMRWADDGGDDYDGNRSIWWSMVYFVFLVMHWMTSRNTGKGKFL